MCIITIIMFIISCAAIVLLFAQLVYHLFVERERCVCVLNVCVYIHIYRERGRDT